MFHTCQVTTSLQFLEPSKPFLFYKIEAIFTHPPCCRCQEIFKRNVPHCLWQCSCFILEFLRPQLKPPSPGNLLAVNAAQMLDSGSKPQMCFANICSVTEWGKQEGAIDTLTKQPGDTAQNERSSESRYKAPHTSFDTNPSRIPQCKCHLVSLLFLEYSDHW